MGIANTFVVGMSGGGGICEEPIDRDRSFIVKDGKLGYLDAKGK
jgi:hypothetical protein